MNGARAQADDMATSLLRYGPFGMPWWIYALLALGCVASGASYATCLWWLDKRADRREESSDG